MAVDNIDLSIDSGQVFGFLGPNGAGKSNILDALCFVLGKSSAKGLRAEKSENLIYNGGKSKNPAKQAEVTIYFDNSNKTFPLDEKEVILTRIVKHSGQSVYKINHKTRTRQQRRTADGTGRLGLRGGATGLRRVPRRYGEHAVAGGREGRRRAGRVVGV